MESRPWQLIIIYAPNDTSAHTDFYLQMGDFVSERTMLAGNFNSVTSSSDHLSGNLDGTSTLLKMELLILGFEEISGSHLGMFTYHHPSLSTHKSQLDRIYVNFPHVVLHRYSVVNPYSDHYAVCSCELPQYTSGPRMWKFLSDLLSNESFNLQVNIICENFDLKNP